MRYTPKGPFNENDDKPWDLIPHFQRTPLQSDQIPIDIQITCGGTDAPINRKKASWSDPHKLTLSLTYFLGIAA